MLKKVNGAWELLKSRLQRVKDKSSVEYLRRTSYLWRSLFIGNRYSKLLREGVLDVGCAIGVMSFFSPSKIYVGIDHSRLGIKQASLLNKHAHFIVGDALTMPIRDSALKTLVASELIEVLDEPEKFFQEARRVLCEGGYIILVACNAYSVSYFIKEIRKWKLKRIFTPSEILAILARNGFVLEKYEGFQLFEPLLNLIKIVLVKSVLGIVRFEERCYYLRLFDSKVAQIVSLFAFKHIFIARKV